MSEQLLVAEAEVNEAPAFAEAAPAVIRPEADPLLRCLAALANHHDRPVAPEALIAGLPLPEGRLTPNLFARAAQRIGYAAQTVARPLKRLNPLSLPAVLLLDDGEACVVFKLAKGGQAEIYDPATDSRTSVAFDDLEAAYTGKAILVKPRADPAQFDDKRAAARGHWFWGVIRLLWPTYAQVIVAAAFINILALASPLFIMNVYDRVLPNKAIPTLWVLALGIGLAILFDLVLRSLRGKLIDGAGRRADVVLASRIFEHVLGLKFASRPATTGSFANRLADFEQVREFFTSGTLATLTDIAFFGLFFLVIYMVAGPLAYIPGRGGGAGRRHRPRPAVPVAPGGARRRHGRRPAPLAAGRIDRGARDGEVAQRRGQAAAPLGGSGRAQRLAPSRRRAGIPPRSRTRPLPCSNSSPSPS
jgi:ABC-type bacteriocin/lantibiotic exporter with double-glycine peptidase domain